MVRKSCPDSQLSLTGKVYSIRKGCHADSSGARKLCLTALH